MARASASASAEAAPEASEEATVTSAGNGTPGYVCGEDWLGPKPEISDDQISETIDTEILVIGGGHSGLNCACAAAEGGAKVDVIEKDAEDVRKVLGEDIGHCNIPVAHRPGLWPL